MEYCDLHCHSNFSDGSSTPEEIIELACKMNLKAVALTDHNSVNGLKRFFKAGEGRIEICGGCEFTTEVDGQELHLLGLFLRPENMSDLESLLNEQLNRKDLSNQITINNLSKAGYPVSYEEFTSLYGKGVLNRVHIARYLMKKGIITSVEEGFDSLLSEKMGYYQESKKLDFYEIISLIKKACGISIWAHPLLHVDRNTCEEIISKAKKCGLDGVEVYYSTYSDDDTNYMRELSRKYSLCESGGSDFHGENKPTIKLGMGYGNLKIPYVCFEKMKKIANERL